MIPVTDEEKVFGSCAIAIAGLALALALMVLAILGGVAYRLWFPQSSGHQTPVQVERPSYAPSPTSSAALTGSPAARGHEAGPFGAGGAR